HPVQLHTDLRPVIAVYAEHPRPDAAVGGVGAAVSGLGQHDIVIGNAADDGIGQRGAVHIPHDHLLAVGTGHQALIAFDAARGVIFRLALLIDELHAVDAVMLHVPVVQVIDDASEVAG